MKRWIHIEDPFDSLITFVCLLGLAATSYWIVHDSSYFRKDLTIDTDKSPMVAEIRSMRNIVKQKPSHLLIWLEAQTGAHLSHQDFVFTDQNSQAEIEFKDQTRLQLEENSLVMISHANDQNQINIEKASQIVADLNASLPLLVKTRGGEVTKLSSPNASLQLNVNSNGDLDVSVTKGQLTIETKRETQKLAPNRATTVFKSGAPLKVRTLSVIPNSPTYNQILPQSDRSPVHFSWNLSEPVQSQTFEISDNIQFSKLIKEVQIPNRNTQADILLPTPGRYFWRIKTTSQNQTQWMTPSALEVITYKPPLLTTPAPETTIQVAQSTSPMEFEWKDFTNSQEFLFQLSQDPQFANIIMEKQVEATHLTVNDLKKGSYFWRVKPLNSKLPMFSSPQKFIIQDPPLPIVSGFSPAANTQVLLAKANSHIEFSWTPSELASSYEFEISTKPSFEDPIVKETLKDYRYRWEPSTAGQIHWRVKPIDVQGRQTQFGQAIPLAIAVAPSAFKSPTSNETITVERGSPRIEFEWTETAFTHSYKLEISEREDFKSILLSQTTTDSEFEWTVTRLGKCFVRVHSLTADGTTIATSQTVPFTIQMPKPKAPKIKLKKEFEIEFKDSPKGTFLWEFFRNSLGISTAHAQAEEDATSTAEATLTWNSVSDATSYVIQISDTEDFAKILASGKSKRAKYTWRNVKKGNYFFRVAVIDRFGQQSEFSEVNSFKMGYGKQITPLLTPTKDEKITYVEKYPTLSFSWNKMKGAKSFLLEVSKNKDFKGFAYEKTQSGRSQKVNTLAEGKYYWRVTPVYANGDYGKESPPWSFEIKKLNAKPELIFPDNGEEFIAINKKSYTQEFEWTESDIKGKYEVLVSHDKEGKKRVKSQSLDTTETKLELEPGETYYWRVSNRVKEGEFTSDPWRFEIKMPERKLRLYSGILGHMLNGSSLAQYGAKNHKAVALDLLYYFLKNVWEKVDFGAGALIGRTAFTGYELNDRDMNLSFNATLLSPQVQGKYFFGRHFNIHRLFAYWTVGVPLNIAGDFQTWGISSMWGVGYDLHVGPIAITFKAGAGYDLWKIQKEKQDTMLNLISGPLKKSTSGLAIEGGLGVSYMF